ncbi:conjugal transfer protein TraI [Echinicola marina]|uniref:conjugal transfer protein TraI n=1 Tax=Echinicola marina TaxID=2859768 RepID=UPI001CF6176D|nr:conjugal transfer protein TraI [Echinicola marina]UCS92326.1 conjugal transfer protein TraI [Echinicola marina]
MSLSRNIKIGLLAGLLCFGAPQMPRTDAAVPAYILEIIRQGVKKAIVAIDLKIQRLQNNTIWLQNAQKVLENTLNKLKLEEIAEWAERQKELYGDYYEGLWKVKSVLTQYQKVRDIAKMQGRLVTEYQKAWGILVRSGNFSQKELQWMEKVYLGILDHSVQNLEEVTGAINAFQLKMSDGERLMIIDRVEKKVRFNLTDLMRFNERNLLISRQRSYAKGEIKTLNDIHHEKD